MWAGPRGDRQQGGASINATIDRVGRRWEGDRGGGGQRVAAKAHNRRDTKILATRTQGVQPPSTPFTAGPPDLRTSPRLHPSPPTITAASRPSHSRRPSPQSPPPPHPLLPRTTTPPLPHHRHPSPPGYRHCHNARRAFNADAPVSWRRRHFKSAPRWRQVSLARSQSRIAYHKSPITKELVQANASEGGCR